MKEYTVILLQLIIWSGFSFIEWLSKHDKQFYNALMFVVFMYIAFLLGNFIMKSARKTVVITFVSLLLYGSLQFSLTWIYSR
jgi:hypothetical protein